jgi:hypothetical protein
MLKGCLVFFSMRLGVPFIAPRQLGAVESNQGRQFLPSVVWHTGQSGARFPSLNSEADRCGFESRWRTGHVRCTPDSPVPSSSRWLGHVSRADCAADRCTTGQSGAPRLSRFLAARAKTFPIGFFLFPALRHNTLVHKSMY